MSTYNRIRERNERYRSACSGYTRVLPGSKDWTLAFSNNLTPYKNLGNHQVVYDRITKPPRPGTIVNNPCCMYKIHGEAMCSDLIYTSPYPNRPDYPDRKYVGNWFCGINVEVGPTWTDSPIDIESRLQDLVSQKAFAQINEAPVDFGLFFAEIDQTLKMLVNPMRGLSSMLNSLVKQGAASKVVRGSRFIHPTKDFNRINDAWLQSQFGMIPLMLDMDAIIKDYEHKVARPIKHTDRSSGVLGVEDTSKRIRYTDMFDGIGWFNLEVYHEKIIKTFVSSSVYWVRSSPRSGYGGSFNDLASFLWELIPYSFVVDWMFSVGTWLKSIQPNETVEYAGNFVSQKTTIEDNYYHTGGYERTTGVPISGTGSRMLITEQRLVRTPNVLLPVTPVFRGPTLSVRHTVDLLSLIWQKMPKLR